MNNISKTSLDGLLFAMMGSNTLVNRWWTDPNKAFDNQAPIDVFAVDPAKVRDYIFNAANLGGADH